MKSISIHCTCGSSIQFTDNAESYINPKDGTPDKKGRRYLIEVRADEYLALHQKCVDTKNNLLSGIGKAKSRTTPITTPSSTKRVINRSTSADKETT